MATNVSATIAPDVVNGTGCRTSRSRHWPNSPRRPNAKNSATPPTTGGSTIDRVHSARTIARPGKRDRASSHASGTPKSSDSAVAPQRAHHRQRSAARTAASSRSATHRPTAPATAARPAAARRTRSATTASDRRPGAGGPAPVPACAACRRTGVAHGARSRSEASTSSPSVAQHEGDEGLTRRQGRGRRWWLRSDTRRHVDAPGDHHYLSASSPAAVTSVRVHDPLVGLTQGPPCSRPSFTFSS